MHSDDTRDTILCAAEDLFAERGVFAVSNRQVGEAAGQRNSSAVGYHFGTKSDLVFAIVDRHSAVIEEHRLTLIAKARGSTDLRDWIACLVIPYIEHLESMGPSSSYARFSAQIMTDPSLRALVYENALESPSLQEILRGVGKCVSSLPASVRRARSDMARQLIVHMSAEHERLAEKDGLGWSDVGTDLVDAIVGIWSAPVTRRRAKGR